MTTNWRGEIFRVGALSAAIILAALASVGCSETTLRAAPEPGGERRAEIVWRQTFPYWESFSSWLVVFDGQGKEILREPLARNRDAPEDLEIEFEGLRWEGGQVVIQSRGVHYSGPSVFSVPGGK